MSTPAILITAFLAIFLILLVITIVQSASEKKASTLSTKKIPESKSKKSNQDDSSTATNRAGKPVLKKGESQEMLDAAKEMASSNPEKTASLLGQWMDQDKS